MDAPASLADAYSRTGAAWRDGPERIYRRLADVLVAASPVPLAGRSVLDLGAGTGAATAAVRAVGGRPIALDVAPGMLAALGPSAPPAVTGDALALPLRTAGVDAVVAAFSLNHLTDPVAGLREAARVTRPGGPILVSAYAEDDGHPVKLAVDGAARARGWRVPAWYVELKGEAMPRLATVERAAATAAAVDLEARVEAVRIPFPELTPLDLVAWRLGMAQLAPFVARLGPGDRADLVTDAVARLGGDAPPLVRSVIVLAAVR